MMITTLMLLLIFQLINTPLLRLTNILPDAAMMRLVNVVKNLSIVQSLVQNKNHVHLLNQNANLSKNAAQSPANQSHLLNNASRKNTRSANLKIVVEVPILIANSRCKYFLSAFISSLNYSLNIAIPTPPSFMPYPYPYGYSTNFCIPGQSGGCYGGTPTGMPI